MTVRGCDYDLRWPDFFILGAPKCGTSTLAAWLTDNPSIYMCQPKEPFFFCTDIRSLRAANTSNEYLGLFAGVTAQHRAVGEASTTYLRSRVAVKCILEKNPDARFIVCLRNPVEMVASVHAQLLRSGREDEPDVVKAWRMQEQRRQGIAIPRMALDPEDLQYGNICRLGAQVQSLLKLIHHERVLFVFLDDLARDPRSAYLKLLTFVGASDDNRTDFGVKNARALPRSRLLNKALMALMILKERLHIRRSLGFGHALARVTTRRVTAAESKISLTFRQELETWFHDDILLLGQLTGRDLSTWHSGDTE